MSGPGGAIANSSGPRYHGQLYDAATDQVYLRNRYYSPGIGRFTSWDPIGYQGGLNTYNYAGSDPVNRWDPMGTDFWETQEGAWIWVEQEDESKVSVGSKYTARTGLHSGGTFALQRKVNPEPWEQVRIRSSPIEFEQYVMSLEKRWADRKERERQAKIQREISEAEREQYAHLHALAGAVSKDINRRFEAAKWQFKEGLYEIATNAVGVGVLKHADDVFDAVGYLRKADDAVATGRTLNRVDSAGDTASALNKSARIGETGIKYWDEVVEGSKQFDRFKSTLVERGWKVIPDSSLSTKADIIHDGTQWVMKYDPKSFNRLDMAHEAFHVGQIQRATAAGIKPGQIMSNTQINLAERGAYMYEKRLSELKGFDEGYSKWIDEMLFQHPVDPRRMQHSSDYRNLQGIYVNP